MELVRGYVQQAAEQTLLAVIIWMAVFAVVLFRLSLPLEVPQLESTTPVIEATNPRPPPERNLGVPLAISSGYRDVTAEQRRFPLRL